MSQSENSSSVIRCVCIIGHNPLSTALLNTLSKTSLHVHLVHSSSHALDLPPPLIKFRISHHQHPNSTFAELDVLGRVLSKLSPPADLVISTGHGGDYAVQTLLIAACIQSSIPRFMPAEFSHDSLNPYVQILLPPHAERARVIDFLQDKSEQGRIEWVGLATGCDISRRLLDSNMGIDLQWQSATVFGTGSERFAASSPGSVSETIKAIISCWDDLRNQYLCISGFTTNYMQIIDALEEEMDCQFEAGYLERDEGVNEAKRRIERGWPDAGMFLLERSALADERCFEGFKPDQGFVKKLALESEPLATVISHVVHEFKHHGKGGCGCS